MRREGKGNRRECLGEVGYMWGVIGLEKCMILFFLPFKTQICEIIRSETLRLIRPLASRRAADLIWHWGIEQQRGIQRRFTKTLMGHFQAIFHYISMQQHTWKDPNQICADRRSIGSHSPQRPSIHSSMHEVSSPWRDPNRLGSSTSRDLLLHLFLVNLKIQALSRFLKK